jgi:hypothetical protein
MNGTNGIGPNTGPNAGPNKGRNTGPNRGRNTRSNAGGDTDPAPQDGRPAPAWPFRILAVVFGLVYAWQVWAGLINLVSLNLAAQSLDTRLSGFGWGLLLAGVLLPALIFAVAARLGRSRPWYAQGALFLVGLGLASALAVDIYQFGLGSLIV